MLEKPVTRHAAVIGSNPEEEVFTPGTKTPTFGRRGLLAQVFEAKRSREPASHGAGQTKQARSQESHRTRLRYRRKSPTESRAGPTAS